MGYLPQSWHMKTQPYLSLEETFKLIFGDNLGLGQTTDQLSLVVRIILLVKRTESFQKYKKLETQML